ncbi:MAG TPA: choice-of-anchor tandem repeat GloVer-containing protein [Candidatus Binatia bacterium]|nr:choice-of-anchor tandem repeat GloVer-containing protein [Candidatus Binatia bacterium]
MPNFRRFPRLTPELHVSTKAALALAIVSLLTIMTSDVASAQGFRLLYTFTGGLDGAQPYAGLTMDRGGNLFGTTHSGNQGTNWGNVYELKHIGTGWTFNALELFDGALQSRAVFGPDGTLYGTSPNNLAGYFYGYVYNLRPPVAAFCRAVLCHWNSFVIYGFSGGSDGATPRYGDLIFDSAGNMYGTAAGGGDGQGGNGHGVVYEMMRSGNGWTQAPIYTFSGPDGAAPYNGVIFDSVGNLYGTTTQGGQNGLGTVFELSPSGGGWTERVLYSFQGGTDGSLPTAGLFMDQTGNLYGSARTGGSGGGGTLFELTPSGGGNWSFSLLHSFSGAANCGPWAALTMNAAGDLFGTTECDGADSAGNVFKLTHPAWTYSTVYDFTGGNDGRFPVSNVIFDAAGNMFGTASAGGTVGQGTIWEITP